MPTRRLLLALLLVLPLTTAGCIDLLSDELEESREEAAGENDAAGEDEVDTGLDVDNSTPGGPYGDASPTNPTLVVTAPATGTPATTTPTAATPPPATTPPPPAATPPPPTATTPPPTATTPTTPAQPPPAAWPREGSYVKYYVENRQSFSGSPQGWEKYANLTWTYTNGDWRGVCEGDNHATDHNGVTTVEHFRVEYTASDPPHWPLFNTRNVPAVGEEVEAWNTRACRIESETWTYMGTETHEASVNGQVRTVPTHRAQSVESDMPFNYRTEWSTSTGLVLYWSHSRSPSQAPSSATGQLIDTDAPL